jgi:hypothetical protein
VGPTLGHKRSEDVMHVKCIHELRSLLDY